MATLIKSLNGEVSTENKRITTTLPRELCEYIMSNYPHMTESAAVRAALMDDYLAFVQSCKGANHES